MMFCRRGATGTVGAPAATPRKDDCCRLPSRPVGVVLLPVVLVLLPVGLVLLAPQSPLGGRGELYPLGEGPQRRRFYLLSCDGNRRGLRCG